MERHSARLLIIVVPIIRLVNPSRVPEDDKGWEVYLAVQYR